MKKAILLTFIMIVSAVCGIGLLANPVSNSNSNNTSVCAFSPDYTTGAVWARSNSFEDFIYGYGGEVKIGSIELPVNSNVSLTDLPRQAVEIEALPFSHFYLKSISVNGSNDNGFTWNTLTAYSDETLPEHLYIDFTVGDYAAYNKFEIWTEFQKIEYEVEFKAVYHHDRSDAPGEWFNYPSDKKIRIGEKLEFSNILEGSNRARFVRFEAKFADLNEFDKTFGYNENYSEFFDIAKMDMFADPDTKEIHIYAVYIETPAVQIVTSEGIGNSNDSAIQILERSIVGGEDITTIPHEGTGTYNFERGSTLTITVLNNNLFQFKDFEVFGIRILAGSGMQRHFVVGEDDNQTVTIKFERVESFKFLFDNQSNALGDDVFNKSITANINGSPAVTDIIKENDTLRIVHSKIDGFRLLGISIRLVVPRDFGDGNGPVNDQYFDILANSGIVFERQFANNASGNQLKMQDYLVEDKITISFYFTRLYALDISVNGFGSFEVRDKDDNPVDLNVNKYFELGEEFNIVAIPDEFNSVVGDSVIPVKMTGDRPVMLVFSPDKIEIEITNSNGITSNISDSVEFSLNKELVLTFDVPSNHELKNIQINGKSYEQWRKIVGNDIRREGNTLVVTLSSTWLNLNSSYFNEGILKINAKAETGFTPMFAALVFGGGSIIPISIIILLTFVFINQKRKKLIREQLIGKRQEKMTLDVGGFLSDIKEGKIKGNISKEDIKKAIKEQKTAEKTAASDSRKVLKEQKEADKIASEDAKKVLKEQKAAEKVEKQESVPALESQKTAETTIQMKPVTPMSAPKPATVPESARTSVSGTEQAKTPAQRPLQSRPQQVKPLSLADVLVGGAIQADRSVVNRDRKKIGTMQSDGTIVDAGGSIIAIIKLATGQIIDKNHNVVGVVTGNGTIVKPSN